MAWESRRLKYLRTAASFLLSLCDIAEITVPRTCRIFVNSNKMDKCFIFHMWILFSSAIISVFGVQLGQVRPLLPHITDPSTLGARITGLQPAHRYRFIVWARTKQGRGEPTFVDVMTAKGQREWSFVCQILHKFKTESKRIQVWWQMCSNWPREVRLVLRIISGELF